MLKRTRIRDSLGQIIQPPKLIHELQNRSMSILAAVVDPLLLNPTLANPRTDDQGRDTDTKTLEIERDVASIGCLFGVGEIVTRWDIDGWWDVVTKSSVLVEGQDEEGFVPLRGVADCLIDSLNKLLAESDWGRRVERLVGAALRVNIGELGQFACLGIGIELIQRSNVRDICSGSRCPGIKCSIWVETKSWASGGVLVVHPGDILLGQLLKNGLLGQTVDIEVIVVSAVTVGCTRGDVRTIGVGRARNRGEPAIKQHEVLGHCVENADLVRGIIVDCLRCTGLVQCLECHGLFSHESAHVLSLVVLVDCLLIWVPRAEN